MAQESKESTLRVVCACILSAKGLWISRLSDTSRDLVPRRQGHGAALRAGNVECATLGTEALAF